MSTILDALRKAQEDTGGKRQPPVGEHPATTEAMTPAPRRRRRIGWPVAVVAVLAVAFAGGLALGDRIVALFGGAPEAPSGEAEVQVAASDQDATEGAGQQAAAAVRDEPPEEAAAPTPIVRRGNRSANADSDAARPVFAQTVDPLIQKRDAAPDAAPAPTPYGQLHVFGAGEAPVKGKPSSEDRLDRLQQLREKMQQAREKAAGQGRAENAAPTQIFVPPPREAAPAGGKAEAPAPAAPAAEPAVEVARAADAAPVGVAQPAADAGAAPIGVSVSNAQGEAAEAEIRDPDAPEPQQAPSAEADPPTTVAALAPDPAPAAAPARGAVPPVLRRAPGGAPQVAINILQWSAEPARRFAFVSVDGGNMTQVREGDHIGGLTIKHIHQQMIEFGFNDSTFLLRAN